MTRCLAPTCTDGPPLTDDDTERRPRITEDGYALCTRCGFQVARNLGDLPALHDALVLLRLHGLPAGTRLGNSPTKGSPPEPARGFTAVHDLLTLMQQQLVSWVLMVCEERQTSVPRNLGPARLASFLLVHHDWLTRHDAAGDLHAEVRDLQRTAEGLAGTRRQQHHSAVPCPDCGAGELYRLDGEEHYLCRACGLTWHEDRRLAHALEVIGEHTVTATEGAALAGINAATFRQWVSRGIVRRVGTDEPARYWREDVLERKDGAA